MATFSVFKRASGDYRWTLESTGYSTFGNAWLAARSMAGRVAADAWYVGRFASDATPMLAGQGVK